MRERRSLQSFLAGYPGFLVALAVDHLLHSGVDFFRRVARHDRREVVAKFLFQLGAPVQTLLRQLLGHAPVHLEDRVHRLGLDVNHNGVEVVGMESPDRGTAHIQDAVLALCSEEGGGGIWKKFLLPTIHEEKSIKFRQFSEQAWSACRDHQCRVTDTPFNQLQYNRVRQWK